MMSIRKKRALCGLAAFVCLAFIIVSVIDFDGEGLKERLVAAVWAEKARKLEIRGALRLKVLPRLGVEMNDVHLSGPNGEGEFLQIGQLRGALEILPLIVGKFSVNRIEARDLTLLAEHYPDGSTNFDDLLAKDEEAEEKPLDFEIGKLVLLGGKFSWHEVASGQKFQLDDVYLRSGAMGLTAHGRLEMGGKLVSAPLEGAIFALDSYYRIDVTAKTLQLDMPRLTLKAREEEQTRLDWTAKQIAADWGAPAFSFSDLKLEGHHTDQNRDKVVASLKLDGLDWHEGGGAVKGGSLRLAWTPDELILRAEPYFSLDAKFGAFTGEKGNWQGDTLEGGFQGNWQGSELTGKLALPFAIEAREAGGARFGVETLMVEAKASGGRLKETLDTRLQGNIEVLLPDGKASGKWQLSQADSRLDFDWQLTLPLRLTFKAALNQLDVDRYWTMEAGSRKEEEDEAEEDEETDEVLSSDFSGELDGILRIGRLRVNGIQIENLESRVVLADGKLAVTSPPEEEKTARQGKGGKNRP
ncbi:MAG: AsmA family protein [Zoogloeaceae bacterium]|jgi:AsmA protein|nr:AsmA family protein [Zoogloeaceae bacterium]